MQTSNSGEGVDVLAQVQSEAAATWRSPRDGKPTVRGVERLRAWCVTSPSRSLHAGVVVAENWTDSGNNATDFGFAATRTPGAPN